ncbi:hypothetical protein CA267_001260 [Alteromonas pelagimontana]|uniref:Uncharacterized protein n=1 Tax=Alteromonas pelagimontana TaxID=1858656 RepID=A0A6M4M971_9ALTE|nr:hypothetical protein [Alteromonas pelagimontana]QJR79519.1 hypothetical protein CA267_001260 [Alteromonas pelagimontana]
MKKLVVAIVLVLVAAGGWLTYLSHTSAVDESANVPVITVMDILHASDLSEGIKHAVKANDDEALTQWLKKAREVGKAADLPEKQLDYLTSQQAKNYVTFNAKRDLFNESFEKRFYQLKGIEDLKKQYPEAKDLFPNAEALLNKRDTIVKSIATTLSNGSAPSEAEMEEARKLWQERYVQQSADTE